LLANDSQRWERRDRTPEALDAPSPCVVSVCQDEHQGDDFLAQRVIYLGEAASRRRRRRAAAVSTF
jgi:hypothetical protein